MKITYASSRLLPVFLALAVLLAACQPAAQPLPTATALPPATATMAPTGTSVPLPTSQPKPTVTVVVPLTGSTASPNPTSVPTDDEYSDKYGDSTGKQDDSRKTPSAAGGALVNMTTDDALGPFLVDERGMTLYLFTKDTPGVTACFEGCLVNWPPLLTDGQPVAGQGVDDSDLGTMTRPDGSVQVTYRGLPLYYFIGDRQPGDTAGQGVGEVWFVVEP